jgi:hypothetical protein
MSEAEAADFLSISHQKLAALRRLGRGPYHIQSRRRIWYSLDDLIFFYKSHTDPLWVPPSKVDGDG